MNQKVSKKHFIGIPIRTSNAHFHQQVLPLWEKFYGERLAEKIPHKLNRNIYAIYTDYEGDYTKPFTYLVGCEVANLQNIPQGMQGVEAAAGDYALFTARGAFPQSMVDTWRKIWQDPMKRAYTTDFELYGPDFNPAGNPEVKIYIALAQ